MSALLIHVIHVSPGHPKLGDLLRSFPSLEAAKSAAKTLSTLQPFLDLGMK